MHASDWVPECTISDLGHSHVGGDPLHAFADRFAYDHSRSGLIFNLHLVASSRKIRAQRHSRQKLSCNRLSLAIIVTRRQSHLLQCLVKKKSFAYLAPIYWPAPFASSPNLGQVIQYHGRQIAPASGKNCMWWKNVNKKCWKTSFKKWEKRGRLLRSGRKMMEMIRYLCMRGFLCKSCKHEVGKERFSSEEGGGGGRGRDATKCPANYPVCIELLCRSGEVRGGRGVDV